MTACTSPLRTTRSTPRRMGVPRTLASRPSITSSLIAGSDRDENATTVDGDVVDRNGAGCRQRHRLAVFEAELTAVLPTLERAFLAVDFAFGQRVVGVRARVADG